MIKYDKDDQGNNSVYNIFLAYILFVFLVCRYLVSSIVDII